MLVFDAFDVNPEHSLMHDYFGASSWKILIGGTGLPCTFSRMAAPSNKARQPEELRQLFQVSSSVALCI
jgi:hypothetical protein